MFFTVTGAAGRWYDYLPTAGAGLWLPGIGIAMILLALLRTTYFRSGTTWPEGTDEPRAIRISLLDYAKASVCWLDGFKRTYAVAPGLYYTGDRFDPDKPLLVTSNYLLTVFILVRRVRFFSANILIIDTDGINVWCSASKGRFSNLEIFKQLVRYQKILLHKDRRLTIILPKFSMSGVDLKLLRQAYVKPVIGPLYAKDLPAYLATPPYRDRADTVHFGFQSRLFTWLPGLIQFMTYCIAAILVLFVVYILFGFPVPWKAALLTVLIATAYPLLFPMIPGKRFAVKGIWLGVFISLGMIPGFVRNAITGLDFITSVLFVIATSLFMGLAYTGNSAVSNYSAVRREIACFLPVDVLLYAMTLIVFIVNEVSG